MNAQQSQGNSFFHCLGGRKQFNGYVATLLLTVMCPLLKASFTEYSLGILGALGLTSGLIALEDRDKNARKMEITTGSFSIGNSAGKNMLPNEGTGLRISEETGAIAMAGNK
ncbi:MAG TPA: hypothetical protein V6D28_16440 [Leptolyngbyaceae cyanobacterium]